MKKFLRSNPYKNFPAIPIILIIFLIFMGESQIFSQYKGHAAVPLSIRNKGVLTLKVDDKGRIYDEQAKPEELSRYSLSKINNKNYIVVHSLNSPEQIHGLKILLRASKQLMANPQALMAFRRAASRWERVINTPITVVIDVDYGPTRWGTTPWGTGVLGSTDAAFYYAMVSPTQRGGVSDIVNVLKSKHQSNSQLQSLYNAIPVPTHTTSGSDFVNAVGGQISLQALGFFPVVTDPDTNINSFGSVPNIGFNSNFGFDLDPSDGITPGLYDFDGVVTHEMGHALGFLSIVSTGGTSDNSFTPMDLFRVRPEDVTAGSLTGFSSATRVNTPGPPPSQLLATEAGKFFYKANQVFFDGMKTYELSTGDGQGQGGDGNQASHWRDDEQRLPSLGAQRTIGIMDPTISAATRDTMRINDIRAFEIIGYDVNYFPKFAGIAVKFNNNSIDLDQSRDTIHLGDVNLNSSKDVPLQLTNLSLDNPLDYAVDIVPEVLIPSSGTASLSMSSAGGSVSAGQSANINFTLNGGQTPSVVYGILRFHTNDNNRLVIDIPFDFSSGNAIAPTVSFTTSTIGDFRFDKSTTIDSLSKDITISNKGTLELDYNLLTSLSTRNAYPLGQPILSKPVEDVTFSNNLYRFYKPKSITIDKVLLSNDFENGFGGFTKTGKHSEDWQLITKGQAVQNGHSKPTAAYFGHDYGTFLQYRPNSNALLISQSIDVSTISTKDMIVLSFNYLLDAEVGFDFASVLISTDDGLTFKQVATSNNGILQNDSTSWHSAMIQIPFLSGNPKPVRIAFKFTSDTLVDKEGFYVDDVQLTAVQNSNSLYTSIRGGTLPGSGSTTFSLIANKANLQLGYYTGTLTVQSNDPKNPGKNFVFNVANLQANTANVNNMYAMTYRLSGKFLKVNYLNGSSGEIGTAGIDAVKSLTINPVTQQLYALNVLTSTNSIVTIDGQNGSGAYYITPDKKIDAMAFDQTGTLYGAGSDMNLYKIDLQTGTTTLMKSLGFNAAAITFNPATGELWISVDAANDKDRLYKLSSVTGDTVLVGRTGLGKVTRALTFGWQNNLYGAIGDLIQKSTLLSINPQTANASQVGSIGEIAVYGLVMKFDSTATSVTNYGDLTPNKFELSQNYPNPFNPTTLINYQIPKNSHVVVKIFNILGQEVTTLVDQDQAPGNYRVEFNGARLSSGVYLYKLQAGNFISVKKMMLTK